MRRIAVLGLVVGVTGGLALLTTSALPETHSTSLLFSDDFESGTMANWSLANSVQTQQSQVWAGAWAATATSTGSPSFARRTLPSTAAHLRYSSAVKVVSKGKQLVSLLRIRTSSNVSIAALGVTARDRHELTNDVNSVQTVSPIVVSKGIWHDIEFEVDIFGKLSMRKVNFYSLSIRL